MMFLKRKTKDFKESNLQIVKEIFNLLNFADGLEPKPFTRKSFSSMGKFLIEKISESKFQKEVSKLFESCCECVPSNYMVSFLII
jgi:hypothetical protein